MTDGNLEVTTDAGIWLMDGYPEPWAKGDPFCCCPSKCNFPLEVDYERNFLKAVKGVLTAPYSNGFVSLDGGEGIAVYDSPYRTSSLRFHGEFELEVDNTEGGVGFVFNYSDIDNFWYVMVDSLQQQDYSFAKYPAVTPTTYNWHKFRSRIIERSSGVDTVHSTKDLHMFEGVFGGKLRIPFVFGLVVEGVDYRVSVKYSRLAVANFQTYFADNRYQPHNFPELNEAPHFMTISSIKRRYGQICTSLPQKYNRPTTYLTHKPGPWGNEDGSKCEHYGLHHDASEQVFCPEYWVAKVTIVVGYDTYVTYYPVATYDTTVVFPSVSPLCRVYFELVNAPQLRGIPYFNIGPASPRNMWSEGDMKLTCQIATASGVLSTSTLTRTPLDPINFWDFDEAYPIPFDSFVKTPLGGNIQSVELWPVTAHTYPTV